MFKQRIFKITALVFAVLVLMLFGGCENALTGILQAIEDQVFGLAAPDVSPEAGTTITAHETIRIEFSESIDPSSVVFGGSMGPYATIEKWEDIPFENGTVYIKPAADNFWEASPDQSLTISCLSVPESNDKPRALVNYTVTWGVFRGVCVDPYSSNTLMDGTTQNPFDSINAGITVAEVTYQTNAEVRIRGTNEVGKVIEIVPGSGIVMKAGISLSGSYDSTWSVADRNLHPTKIVSDNDAGGGTENNPEPLFEFTDAGIGTETVIGNLEILCGDGAWDAGIYAYEASPTIRNIKIRGYFNSSDDSGYGIYLKSSGAIIENCDIFTEWGSSIDGSISTGIRLTCDNITQSSVTISGNTISGGYGTISNGIHDDSGGTNNTIINNTIDGGMGITEANGIYCEIGNPLIQSNTIFAASNSDAGSANCIFIGGYSYESSNPRVENNTFNNLPVVTAQAIAIYESTEFYSDPATLTGNIFSFLGFNKTMTTNDLYYRDDNIEDVNLDAQFSTIFISTTSDDDTLTNLGNSTF